MSQNSSPNNVPSAKQGTADSLAAPRRVGAGDTNYMCRPGDAIVFAMVALFEDRPTREQALYFLMLELEGMRLGAFA